MNRVGLKCLALCEYWKTPTTSFDNFPWNRRVWWTKLVLSWLRTIILLTKSIITLVTNPTKQYLAYYGLDKKPVNLLGGKRPWTQLNIISIYNALINEDCKKILGHGAKACKNGQL